MQVRAHRRGLTSNHDVLLGPAGLYVDDAKEALVFRHENQGAASWGILLDSLLDEDEDPAVVVRLDLADKSAERWGTGWSVFPFAARCAGRGLGSRGSGGSGPAA